MFPCCEKIKPYAPLFLRFGLGIIFVYHGFAMIFGEGAGLGSSWNSHGMAVLTQILVSWGEFLCGGAILLGFLTEIASLGIIVIMLGAIILIHGKNGFNIMHSGFEYNYALIMMALALMASGPGPCKLGCKCKKK